MHALPQDLDTLLFGSNGTELVQATLRPRRRKANANDEGEQRFARARCVSVPMRQWLTRTTARRLQHYHCDGVAEPERRCG